MRSFKNIAGLLTLIIIIFVVIFVVAKNPENSLGNNMQLSKKPAVDVAQASLRDSIVAYGLYHLDTPYITAGCSAEGFDCSGFVYFVFQHFDINVPRSSADYKDFGTEITIENVEKGDVLLFLSPTRDVIGHIGIVSNAKGINSDFVHATSGRQMKVVVTNLYKTGYRERFVKAVRVF